MQGASAAHREPGSDGRVCKQQPAARLGLSNRLALKGGQPTTDRAKHAQPLGSYTGGSSISTGIHNRSAASSRDVEAVKGVAANGVHLRADHVEVDVLEHPHNVCRRRSSRAEAGRANRKAQTGNGGRAARWVMPTAVGQPSRVGSCSRALHPSTPRHHTAALHLALPAHPSAGLAGPRCSPAAQSGSPSRAPAPEAAQAEQSPLQSAGGGTIAPRHSWPAPTGAACQGCCATP